MRRHLADRGDTLFAFSAATPPEDEVLLHICFPVRYCVSNSEPARQSYIPETLLLSPPLTEEATPDAVLLLPPLTEE